MLQTNIHPETRNSMKRNYPIRPILLLLLTGIILQASSCQSKKSTKHPDDMASVRSDSFFDQNTIPISVLSFSSRPISVSATRILRFAVSIRILSDTMSVSFRIASSAETKGLCSTRFMP